MRPIVFTLLLLYLAGCQERNDYVAPPPPGVTVAYPVEQSVQEYFETTGQTRSVKTVELRARVSGYLQNIDFKDGDMVEADQLLYVIDPAPYEAAVASAEAAVQKAKAQQQLAEQNLKRTNQLIAQNIATESELEVQQAEQASAVADVAAAEASLRDAKLNLSYTKIHAPFAGRIGHHMVDVGNLVQIGETALAKIEAVTPIHAYFTISEADLLRFMRMQRTGQLRMNDSDPLNVEMALGNSEEFDFKGQLDFREFGVDPATGTTQRRAVFQNEDGELIPGLFVRVRAAVGEPAQKLLVPEEALGSDQRGEYLLIVKEDNTVEYRSVQTGLLLDGMRVIENGISKTDRVITVGLQRARPGSPVTVTAGPGSEEKAPQSATETDKTAAQAEADAGETKTAAEAARAAEENASQPTTDEVPPAISTDN